MTVAALSHKLVGWKVRLIGTRMPQMNGRFDHMFGRFFYKNQCSTIITTGEPSSLIWAAALFSRGLSVAVCWQGHATCPATDIWQRQRLRIPLISLTSLVIARLPPDQRQSPPLGPRAEVPTALRSRFTFLYIGEKRPKQQAPRLES